ncbi:MAG: DUF4432 domain-containing protein [Chloroflexi bacterium]|nr:MAG: DUF4432 domain-containing protein [Chloroflexota bacterium]
MPFLYNRQYTPLELKQFADLSQLAGVRLVEYQEGKTRGMRVAQVYTGSGLRFEILLDRALDIGAAEHNGRALAWTYPALGAPQFYDPRQAGWVRTFGGGLVTTCGLDFFGQPENDNSQELGLHGRISHTPAEQTRVTTEWRGDDYVLQVEGRARQAAIFGENLVLTRRVTTRLGANSFTLHDTVTNEGFRAAPHMLLYHCNFGFPVVSPDSEILLDVETTQPRDGRAAKGLTQASRFENPAADYPEQVFFHAPRADAQGYAQAKIMNRALHFGAYVKWRMANLPYLGQWKLMQAGEYVCALEPATSWETPRAQLRREGRLKMLAPGESVAYELELGALFD